MDKCIKTGCTMGKFVCAKCGRTLSTVDFEPIINENKKLKELLTAALFQATNGGFMQKQLLKAAEKTLN